MPFCYSSILQSDYRRMNTQEISRALKSTAALLELRGENPFKIRAYSTATELLDSLQGELADFVRDCSAGKVKGIGPQLAQSIESLYERGRLALLEELENEFPKTILELFALPGLGPKKIKRLYEELKISSLAELKRACEENRIAKLKGFGENTQTKFLAAIELHLSFAALGLRTDAEHFYSSLSAVLAQAGCSSKFEPSGQFRRGLPVLDCLDVVVESASHERCLQAIRESGLIADCESDTDVLTGRTEKGLRVRVRVAAANEFAATLFQSTGSEEHVAAVCAAAGDSNPPSQTTEEEIYEAAGLRWIPPERREPAHGLPKTGYPSLVEVKDIRGILHAHSTYSDGKNSLAEMAAAAKERGFQYLGITDHSQSAAYANGLKEAAIMKQHAEIDLLNAQLAPFRIFKGIESDILADGSLDYPDDILALFDFVIVSVHSRFSMSEADMTKRIIRAIENRYADILAHPTGRLLLKRDGYTIDTAAVLAAAAENGVAVEINSNPKRLDLDWTYVEQARDRGILLPICPDAHSVNAIDNIRHGAFIARKGALEPKHVLNCLSAAELEAYFRKRKKR